MQNSSSRFQLWAVSFDLFSHCVGSSLQPISTLYVSNYLPKTGEQLCCSYYCVCHTDPPWSSIAVHSVVWSNVDSNHHTFFFAFPPEGMVCMRGWRLKGKEREDPCKMFYWNVQRAVNWQWVGWKSALHLGWAVGKKWCDSRQFKLKSFSLQLRWAQTTQADYYYTLSEEWKLINL